MSKTNDNYTSIKIMETRMQNFENQMKDLNIKVDRGFVEAERHLKEVDEKIDSLIYKLDKRFVTVVEWTPYKRIISGAVGFILVTVLGAFMALIIISSV